MKTRDMNNNIGTIAVCVVWRCGSGVGGVLISSLIISVISKQHEDREKYGPGEDVARMYSGQ